MFEIATSIKALVSLLIFSGCAMLLVLLFYYIAVMVDSYSENKKNRIRKNLTEKDNNNEDKKDE